MSAVATAPPPLVPPSNNRCPSCNKVVDMVELQHLAQSSSAQAFLVESVRDDGLYAFRPPQHGNISYVGIWDSDWNAIVFPQFQSIGLFPSDGDPDGLAWATYTEKVGKTYEGFINRRGEFVLIAQRSML
jgi:hypothetical protein